MTWVAGRTALLAWACVALCSLGCATSAASKPLSNEPRLPAPLHQLMPQDLDLVARVDWERARRLGVDDEILGAAIAMGFPRPVLERVAGCLVDAKLVLMGMRLGPTGLDGDALVLVRGSATAKAQPCDKEFWDQSGRAGGMDVFHPSEAATGRGTAALMLRSSDGSVMISTPGQVDALLRVLRDGPDAQRLEPAADGLVSMQARIEEAVLPSSWRASASNLTGLTRGLVIARGTLELEGEVAVSLVFSYADEADAVDAAVLLSRVQRALLGSGRAAYKQAAQSAHAERVGEVIKVKFTVPSPGSSEPP